MLIFQWPCITNKTNINILFYTWTYKTILIIYKIKFIDLEFYPKTTSNICMNA